MPEDYFKTFNKETYDSIKSRLLSYRLDPFIRKLESKKGKHKGLIFPFVRGLRFSALLTYAIRECLSVSELEVSWGQIIDDEGYLVSGECDIIIHHKGYKKRWNGASGGNHIMDFKFIKKENVIIVISCKSHLTKAGIEKEYCSNMLKYVNKIWLFTECCGPKSAKLIKDESQEIGYEKFYYLYTWNRRTGDIGESVENWYDFMENVEALK